MTAQNRNQIFTGVELTAKSIKPMSHCRGCAIGKITRRKKVVQRANRESKRKIKAGGMLKDDPHIHPTTRLTREIPVKRTYKKSEWYTAKQIIEMVPPYGFELVTDAVVPQPRAWNGHTVGWVFKDTSTKTTWWITTRTRSDIQATIVGDKLRKMLSSTMDPSKITNFFRLKSDNASELLSEEFHRNVGMRLGISERRLTTPGSSYQNGHAERQIRQTTESFAACKEEQGVPDSLWTFGYEGVESVADHLPCKGNPNWYSPNQMRHVLATGTDPEPEDLSWLRILFTRVSYVDPGPRTMRIRGRGKLGIFVGLKRGVKGYRVIPIDHSTMRLQPSKVITVQPEDIYFDERNRMPTRLDIRNILYPNIKDNEEEASTPVITFAIPEDYYGERKHRKHRKHERVTGNKRTQSDSIGIPTYDQPDIEPELDNKHLEQDTGDEIEIEPEPEKEKPPPPGSYERVTEASRVLQRIEAGQRGLPKGVSHYEPILEGDHDNQFGDQKDLIMIKTRTSEKGVRRSARLHKKSQPESRDKKKHANAAEIKDNEVEHLMACIADKINKIEGAMVAQPINGSIVTRSDVGDLPRSPEQARKHKFSDQWVQAEMDQKKKLESFHAFGPEIKIEDIPTGKRTLKVKWVYELETNKINLPSGKVEEQVIRFKARLVAMGFLQRYGIDYDAVFSPTPAWVSIRLLLALAAQHDMSVAVLDVSGAFLHAKLDHELYITGLPWMKKGVASRIVRALYGTKQAGRKWHQLFKKTVKKEGFKESLKEPCILYKWERRNGKLEVIIIIVWVDDAVVVSTRPKLTEDLVKNLKKTLKIRKYIPLEKVGDSVSILGGELTKVKNGYHLGSVKSVNNLLTALSLTSIIDTVKKRGTPMTPGIKLTDVKLIESSKKLTPEKHAYYRTGVGILSHLTNFCGPILAYARSQLSSCLNDPREVHFKELVRVATFMGQNIELGLHFKTGINPQYPGILTRSDSSYKDHLPTMKSTESDNNFYNYSIVAWRSKRQKTVAKSTLHAETGAAVEGIATGKYIQYTLEEILPPEWIDVMGIHTHEVDNKGTHGHIVNKKTIEATKHLPVRYFYIREQVENKNLMSNWIPTELNDADLGTKAVSKKQFDALLPNVMAKLTDLM